MERQLPSHLNYKNFEFLFLIVYFLFQYREYIITCLLHYYYMLLYMIMNLLHDLFLSMYIKCNAGLLQFTSWLFFT